MIQGLYNSIEGMSKAEDAFSDTAASIAHSTTVDSNRSYDEQVNQVRDKVDLSAKGRQESDLTRDMTNMIVEERAFQYNASAVKTQDEMLGTIINVTG